MFTNAVFQGGGVKGIALVGALEKIEEYGIRFESVSGTSAGSIVASLYAVGYRASEIKAILDEMDFEELLDPTRIKYYGLIKNKGLYKGDKFYDWIFKLLKQKNIENFEDLGEIDLRIVASDLTNRKLLVFNRLSNPTLKIAEAVRMSISIPFVFKPYKFGEKLVVDGGVLSNYPLFTSNDPKTTLGFKLVSETIEPPKPPSSILKLAWSLVGTMMDAHDKEAENKSSFENSIQIDSGLISSIKFGLTKDEKELLYKNGYHAASKFLTDNQARINFERDESLIVPSFQRQSLEVGVPKGIESNESIRVSISALFRICIDSNYLLIKGSRIDQFQPVGGVLRRLESASGILQGFAISDDDKLPIDDFSRGDLRVRVPFSSLYKFLEWYQSESDREISPWREFYEELIEPKLLPSADFKYVFYEHKKTHVEGIRYSQHFSCNELLIAEIYELKPNAAQTAELRKLNSNDNPTLLWCSRDLISSKGYDPTKKKDVARISEHSSWLL